MKKINNNKLFLIFILFIIYFIINKRRKTVIEGYYNFFTPSIDKDAKLITDKNILKYNNDIIKYEYYYDIVRFGLNTHNYLVYDQNIFLNNLIKNILAYSNIVNIAIRKFNTSYYIIEAVSKKLIDIGITSTPVLMKQHSIGSLNNINYICNLEYHYVYVITNKYTGISSINELKGKKINLGVVNTTSAITGDNILRQLNLSAYGDYIPSNYNTDIALHMLARNELDIVFFTDTYPSKYLYQYNKSKIYLIIPIKGLNNDIFTARYSYYTPTYFYNDIPTYKFSNVMICNEHTSDTIVYHAIKQIFTKRKNVIKNSFQPKYPDIKESIYIPLHKGAKRYLTETGHISTLNHSNCPYFIGKHECTTKHLKDQRLNNHVVIYNEKYGSYDTNILKNRLLV
jgi:TRAP-type uncharacterized transport system substrate-binding protein